MTLDIQRVRNVEKRLVFARKKTDGSFHVFSKTFPAGLMGISLNETFIDANDFSKLMEAYNEFCDKEQNKN